MALLSCGTESSNLDIRDLCQSWVIEESVDGKTPLLSSNNELHLTPYKSGAYKSKTGLQFVDTGKIISFRVVNGKRQDFKFIHGLWATLDNDQLLINMDGTKPIFNIIELKPNKLIIKKDGLLAD